VFGHALALPGFDDIGSDAFFEKWDAIRVPVGHNFAKSLLAVHIISFEKACQPVSFGVEALAEGAGRCLEDNGKISNFSKKCDILVVWKPSLSQQS
jgi:hypothetical protein